MPVHATSKCIRTPHDNVLGCTSQHINWLKHCVVLLEQSGPKSGLQCLPLLLSLQLELAVKTQQADFVDVRVADALRQVSDLELLEVCGWGLPLP